MNRNSQIYLFDVGLIYSLIPGGLSFLPYIRPFTFAFDQRMKLNMKKNHTIFINKDIL